MTNVLNNGAENISSVVMPALTRPLVANIITKIIISIKFVICVTIFYFILRKKIEEEEEIEDYNFYVIHCQITTWTEFCKQCLFLVNSLSRLDKLLIFDIDSHLPISIALWNIYLAYRLWLLLLGITNCDWSYMFGFLG